MDDLSYPDPMTEMQAPCAGALFGALRGRGRLDAVCTICGHHGAPRQHRRGSTALEAALWLMALLPGALYRAWRILTVRRVCSACGAEHVVPPDSPLGRRLLAAQALV